MGCTDSFACKIIKSCYYYFSLIIAFVCRLIDTIIFVGLIHYFQQILYKKIREFISAVVKGVFLAIIFVALTNIFYLSQVCYVYLLFLSYILGCSIGTTPFAKNILPIWNFYTSPNAVTENTPFVVNTLFDLPGLVHEHYIGLFMGISTAFPFVTARNVTVDIQTTVSNICTPSQDFPVAAWCVFWMSVGVISSSFIAKPISGEEKKTEEHRSLTQVSDAYNNDNSSI